MAVAKTSARRRVYLLPDELIDRIGQYRRAMNFTSEADAVRSLLEIALQTRDTPETLLGRLSSAFKHVGDLRALTTEVLSRHPMVTSYRFEGASLYFTMGSNQAGRLDADGSTYILRRDDKGAEVYSPYPQE